jgi:hypothetical protein
MWVLKGNNFFSVPWEICSEIIPLNDGLNPICHLLALLGAHNILHGSRIRVNCGTTTFCVQQINIQALRKVQLKQASGEPLSSTGGYRSFRVQRKEEYSENICFGNLVQQGLYRSRSKMPYS